MSRASHKVLWAGWAVMLAAAGALGGGCGKSETHVTRDNSGAECLMDSDCPEGSLCHASGVCVEECSRNLDCAGDEICSEGRCVRQTTDDCEYPCPANMGCVAGRCLWQCQLNTECPAKYECKGGFCDTGGCTEHSECSDGQGCFGDLRSGNHAWERGGREAALSPCGISPA